MVPILFLKQRSKQQGLRSTLQHSVYSYSQGRRPTLLLLTTFQWGINDGIYSADGGIYLVGVFCSRRSCSVHRAAHGLGGLHLREYRGDPLYNMAIAGATCVWIDLC